MRERVARLEDRRLYPQIPVASIWLSVLAMFCLRLRSLNALAQQQRQLPKAWRAWVGERQPSADTIAYSLERFSLATLRQELLEINHRAWRLKGIHRRAGETQRVVAIDAHDLFSTSVQGCEACLKREHGEGEKKLTSYHHRVVVAQWVGVVPPGILDLELIQPGEGEVIAARRLLKRLLKDYSRLIDVITADALYLEAPFIREVLEAGKHVVVVMKQEARDLYKEADELRRLSAPEVIQEPGAAIRRWDLPTLRSFTTLGRPMRVVWAEETHCRSRRRGSATLELQETKTWVWVSDLTPEEASAAAISRWGHDRWDIENRGFNELAGLWGMDHCFHHDATAIEALLLTLAMAFLLTYLFYERNLQPPKRRELSRASLALCFLQCLAAESGGDLWAPLEFSG